MIKAVIKSGEYHDSVSLMLVQRELAALTGVQDAAVVMGTEANKSILAEAGLLNDVVRTATANDLVIAVLAEDEAQAEEALVQAEMLLKKKATTQEASGFRSHTLRGALSNHPDANLAVISVAGRYAAREAWEALEQGLHVLLFSDNVSLEDEIALKIFARDHGLLLMGPGAGTAILNGIGLGFANAVPAGPVGIVSAAGTGLQEVSSQLARLGVGIRQGIGVGGRDLKKEVGGIMMLEGLKALQRDPKTEVIVLISKPPASEVVEKIRAQVQEAPKPVVVCFLGGDMGLLEGIDHLQPVHTLQGAVLAAARLAGANVPTMAEFQTAEDRRLYSLASKLRPSLSKGQRFVRGLYSGGTLCYEAQVIWLECVLSPVASNAPIPCGQMLEDSTHSQGHSAIDLGEEEFTIGRPHPMVDNDLRIRRLFQEAADPETAVILLDVVLGYGAHPDPAGELAPAIQKAARQAESDGRHPIFLASVTGTEADPQRLSRTTALLEAAGVTVCDSNASAARLAGMILSGLPS